MADPSARELHEQLMNLIRFSVPDQVMIDDVWIKVRRGSRFIQSYDRYHVAAWPARLVAEKLLRS